MSERIRVIVTGIRRETSFDAIIDTGFDGYLCLPVQIAIQVGLELYGAQVSELADGSTRVLTNLSCSLNTL